jgi:hypothetical protein
MIRIPLSAFVLLVMMIANAFADVVNLQCFGFPASPWAMRGNNVEVDAARQMIKSLDSHYQWISANFSERSIQWVSHGATGDGTSITYIFGLDRAGLSLYQTVSANNRAVYTGTAQCQISQAPRNKL